MRALPNHWRPAPLLLLLAALSGCTATPAPQPAVTVQVQAVHPTLGPMSAQISADAILAPVAIAAISSPVEAPIRKEYVHRGMHVHRGELLIALDNRQLQGNALDSEGSLLAARANLKATEDAVLPEQLATAQRTVAQLGAALALAKRTAQQRRTLYQQGALSGQEAEAAHVAAVQAQADFETARQRAALLEYSTRATETQSARAQLLSAEGKLQSAQAQMSFASLRSPIDGVVTGLSLFPGEMATAGAPLITVMDTSSLLAKLHLAQASAQQLQPGDAASIVVPGEERPVPAKVSFISPALDPGSTTVEVWLTLANPDGRFRVGTPVHVLLRGTPLLHVLQVPPSALIPNEDAGAAVMVITPGGVTKTQPVQVGIRNPDAVQILSGIGPDATVVTEGGYGLDDGTAVRVVSRETQ